MDHRCIAIACTVIAYFRVYILVEMGIYQVSMCVFAQASSLRLSLNLSLIT